MTSAPARPRPRARSLALAHRRRRLPAARQPCSPGCVGTAVIDWRANEDVAVEAVTTHVRATLNNHLIEVASSDQHTVKPWLSARLDYSPPVQDLANEGFRAERRQARYARQAAGRHAGLPLSATHDRRLRQTRVGACAVGIAHRARLQRRARDRLRHGLARGIRRQRRRPDRIRPAARAIKQHRSRWCLKPQARTNLRIGVLDGVADGTRTRDNWNHIAGTENATARGNTQQQPPQQVMCFR